MIKGLGIFDQSLCEIIVQEHKSCFNVLTSNAAANEVVHVEDRDDRKDYADLEPAVVWIYV